MLKTQPVAGSVILEASVDAFDASTWQAHQKLEEEDNTKQRLAISEGFRSNTDKLAY